MITLILFLLFGLLIGFYMLNISKKNAYEQKDRTDIDKLSIQRSYSIIIFFSILLFIMLLRAYYIKQ